MQKSHLVVVGRGVQNHVWFHLHTWDDELGLGNIHHLSHLWSRVLGQKVIFKCLFRNDSLVTSRISVLAVKVH